MRRTYPRTTKTITVKCPDCGASIELDHPIVDGDENDMTRLQGTCECGHEVSQDADEADESDFMDREFDAKHYGL